MGRERFPGDLVLGNKAQRSGSWELRPGDPVLGNRPGDLVLGNRPGDLALGNRPANLRYY